MRGNWSRRRFLVATGGVTGAALLAACAPTPAPGVSEPGVEAVETVAPSGPAAEAPVTLQFWTPGGGLFAEQHDVEWEEGAKVSTDADGKEQKEYWPWIRIYQMQQTYPNVTVECQTFGWGEYWEKFDVAFAAGVVPDIILMTPDRMPKYSKAGGLLDLWDISETLGLKAEDYYESSIEAFTTIENKLEAWPNATYAVGFGVNLGNVKERGAEGMLPPGPDYQLQSFDDTMELLKALTYERDGQQVWGTIWVGGGGGVSQWPYTGSVVWGHGADWLCNRGRADEVCLDTEAGIAAIKWIEDSIFTHKVAPEGMAVATGNEINDLWFRSRLSLYHSAWGGGMQGHIQQVKTLQEAGEDVPDLEVQLMRPPAVEGAEPAVVSDPIGFSLPKTDDAGKQQWAAEFMKLMVTGDAVDDGRPYYISAHVATAREQQELDPYLAYEAEYLIPIGRPRGAHPKYAEIANLWQQEIQAVLAGTKHADEAVTSFAEAARIALREA